MNSILEVQTIRLIQPKQTNLAYEQFVIQE